MFDRATCLAIRIAASPRVDTAALIALKTCLADALGAGLCGGPLPNASASGAGRSSCNQNQGAARATQVPASTQPKVHSLIDKVYDPANLAEAWKRVRENKGSAGIDGLTLAGFEQRQDELLERLHKQLQEKTYRPSR
jgi:hypothetical protein